MKKYYILLILFFTFILPIKAEEPKVYIDNIEQLEISPGVEEKSEPVINDLIVNFDLKFTEVNSYIKYKIIIFNKDSEEYTLGSNDKNSNSYIKYEYSYENDNKVVPANSEKTMYLTIRYSKEVPVELYKDGKYNEVHTLNLSFFNNRLPDELVNKIDNPNTNTASIIFIILAVILSFVISFLLSSRKFKRYIRILLIIISLSPILVYAINTLYLSFSTKIEILAPKYAYCFFDISANEITTSEFTMGDTIASLEMPTEIAFLPKEVVTCEYTRKQNIDTETYCALGDNTVEVNNEDYIKDESEGCYYAVK